jgi:hypothetical protein
MPAESPLASTATDLASQVRDVESTDMAYRAVLFDASSGNWHAACSRQASSTCRN